MYLKLLTLRKVITYVNLDAIVAKKNLNRRIFFSMCENYPRNFNGSKGSNSNALWIDKWSSRVCMIEGRIVYYKYYCLKFHI